MDVELPEDMLMAMRAHALEPEDFPEAGCPPGADEQEWLRDRERIWDRASRVLEAIDAARAADPFPAWFGSEWHQMLRHPWATRLEWAVEEAEKHLA